MIYWKGLLNSQFKLWTILITVSLSFWVRDIFAVAVNTDLNGYYGREINYPLHVKHLEYLVVFILFLSWPAVNMMNSQIPASSSPAQELQTHSSWTMASRSLFIFGLFATFFKSNHRFPVRLWSGDSDGLNIPGPLLRPKPRWTVMYALDHCPAGRFKNTGASASSQTARYFLLGFPWYLIESILFFTCFRFPSKLSKQPQSITEAPPCVTVSRMIHFTRFPPPNIPLIQRQREHRWKSVPSVPRLYLYKTCVGLQEHCNSFILKQDL